MYELGFVLTRGGQQRGVAGFFDGSTLRMSRKIFSSAIGWAVYEGVLIAFKPGERV